ncbi:hypothetical protein [Streptantibioticus silvisoli]|uniref:hypothetical protein n=1 Tax=Streptantibioticus silvisoli TaxID=2705255 RepID=UPI003F6D341D
MQRRAHDPEGPVCRGCRLRDVCGGGHHAHRYRDDGSGFANPSVYCADLQALIDHIRRRLAADVARLAREGGGTAARTGRTGEPRPGPAAVAGRTPAWAGTAADGASTA